MMNKQTTSTTALIEKPVEYFNTGIDLSDQLRSEKLPECNRNFQIRRSNYSEGGLN